MLFALSSKEINTDYVYSAKKKSCALTKSDDPQVAHLWVLSEKTGWLHNFS